MNKPIPNFAEHNRVKVTNGPDGLWNGKTGEVAEIYPLARGVMYSVKLDDTGYSTLFREDELTALKDPTEAK